jgi:osmotically-inducible protein OsmY
MIFKIGKMAAVALIGVSLACTGPNREKAQENEAKASDKTRQQVARAEDAGRKLAKEAKAEAKDLGRKIDNAVQPDMNTEQARAKLREGRDKLENAGSRAAVKLDRAALAAKVKAKLANDVGLKTLTNVEVDSAGQVVTLRGTVSSDAQKQEAGQAAASVEGVAKVLNQLRVER